MKILCITTKCPYPPVEGMTLRTYNHIKHVARYAEVHLLTLMQGQEESAGLEHMREHCAIVRGVLVPANRSRVSLLWTLVKNVCSLEPFVCAKYDVPAMRRMIREQVQAETYDAVHFDLLPLAVYRNETPGLRKILVEHNIESHLLYRRALQEGRPLLKLFFLIQMLKLRRFERTVCPEFDQCVVMSEPDKKSLQAMAPRAEIVVIPNGVDTGYFVPEQGSPDPHTVVFVGSQSWHPNLDAIRFFVAEIMPKVIDRCPDIRAYFVGKKVRNDLVPSRYKQSIIMTGLVEDIRPLVARSSVYIVPLRVGGGTRLKILDALAMGKAIVSTSIGCEGIEVTDGRDIVIADGSDRFADALVRLLDNPEVVQRLGAGARQLAVEKYSWESIFKDVRRIYAPSTEHGFQAEGATS